jgi:zinc transport system substrate-binding protein
MNKKYTLVIFIGIMIMLIAFAMNRVSSPAATSGKLTVAASFYPLAYFAQQIGGDKADVINVTPAGAEPHDYTPTPSDMAAIESSDILILNGGRLEAWGDSVKQNISAKTQVVVAGEGLVTQNVVEDGQSIIDPHVWLSPILAKQMVAKITTAFVQADPSNAKYYTARADGLSAKLASLDAQYRTDLAHCARTDFVTSHAAFGYLASSYNLTQTSITGLSPDAEPSPKQLAEIVVFAKKNHVSTIFFESLISPKLANTIAHEVGAKTAVLDPIEGITSDRLAAGDTYMTVMTNNLNQLTMALQCTP